MRKISILAKNGLASTILCVPRETMDTNSVTAIYSYVQRYISNNDAVISHIEDAFRVLVPGGRALFHHSNYDKSTGAFWNSNPCPKFYVQKSFCPRCE